VQTKKVLVFKEAPKVIRTDLTKALGQPREIDKNLEDTKYFDKEVDIKFPLQAEEEKKSQSPTKIDSAFVDEEEDAPMTTNPKTSTPSAVPAVTADNRMSINTVASASDATR